MEVVEDNQTPTTKRVPSTTKQRVQKFRQKIKTDRDYQQKESRRIENMRKKRVSECEMTNAEKDKYKQATRDQKQKGRANKRALQNSQTAASVNLEHESPDNQAIPITPSSSKTSPYARPQSLGKAVINQYAQCHFPQESDDL